MFESTTTRSSTRTDSLRCSVRSGMSTPDQSAWPRACSQHPGAFTVSDTTVSSADGRTATGSGTGARATRVAPAPAPVVMSWRVADTTATPTAPCAPWSSPRTSWCAGSAAARSTSRSASRTPPRRAPTWSCRTHAVVTRSTPPTCGPPTSAATAAAATAHPSSTDASAPASHAAAHAAGPAPTIRDLATVLTSHPRGLPGVTGRPGGPGSIVAAGGQETRIPVSVSPPAAHTRARRRPRCR